MDIARLYRSGRTQTVRLPESYRFSGTEVLVKRFGNGVLLLPVENPWQVMVAGLATFEPGFLLTRDPIPQRKRTTIDTVAADRPPHSTP